MRKDQLERIALGVGVFLAALALFPGCGSSTSDGGAPAGSVAGSVQGRAFKARTGAFDQMADLSLLIAVPESDGMCQLAASGGAPAGDSLWLSVYVCAGAGDAAGEYPIQPGGGGQTPCPGRVAWAEVRSFLAGTPSVIPVDSGTVTIETHTDQELTGRATLALGSDSLAGSFSASYCAALNKP